MNWIKTPIEGKDVRSLASSYNLDLLTASILTRREITDPEKIAFFLERDERLLHNPFLFPQMERAVERVLEAAREGEKVLVFGDKDVDGITATVIMVEALRSVGLAPEWRVPIGEEHYGLNSQVLQEKATEDFSLVITVDCGITNFDEISLASSLNMDVIIFDHHMPQEEKIPTAYAIINPKLSGEYPFSGLCAAAIASKFHWALCLAGTEIWEEEQCLIHTEFPDQKNAVTAGNDSQKTEKKPLVIEAIRMRNLQEVARIKVSQEDGEIGRERIIRFIEGLPLLTYDKAFQIPLISSFFGGVEVHLADMAPKLATMFPAIKGRSIKELSKISPLARYFPKNNDAINTLANLAILLYSHSFASAFIPWRRDLDLVALGTLADMMPLIDENRLLVRMGLQRLNMMDTIKERRSAIRELLIRQRLHEGTVDTTELSWQLCPLINASGRMGRADIGVKLFLATDPTEISALADELINFNKKRRALSQEIWDNIYPQSHQSMDNLNGKMVIIADEKTPRGITGILAMQLQKSLGVMSVMISRGKDISSGSVRSAPDNNVLEWMKAMEDLFDDFGGHPQAGGFQIASEKIDKMIQRSRTWIGKKNPSRAESETLRIDAELPHDEIIRLGRKSLEGLLEQFEPYGAGFSPLTFLTKSVRIHQADLIGKPKNNHLKLLVSFGAEKWPALWWDGAEQYGKTIKIDADFDLIYRIDKDRWRGTEARRLTILEASPCTD